MTISPAQKRKMRMVRRQRRQRRIRQLLPLPTATLVMLGGMLGAVAIALAWLLDYPAISQGFASLAMLQQNPPSWLEVPAKDPRYLFLPTVGLFTLVFGVMRLSPKPRPWARRLVVAVLLILTVRYVLWRVLSTLNLSTPLNGILSLLLLALELLMLSGALIQLGLMLRMRDRRSEANRYAAALLSGQYAPTVDIFIPTYNEPAFILRRSIIGCQAMEYPHKQIYVLDDTRRPEIAALAHELGCRYLTRSHSRHAKAGNLNNGLQHSQGELVVVFDADFVPTRNFLSRTLGFFQNPNIALVQTPQSFYNPDPIARNLGLEQLLTPEEEVFYRQIQPIRDGVGGVICAGTSFVVRRSALEATGGFVTESLSEDYFTGIAIAAQGHEVVYLNEKLSAGLAAENIAAHALQRIRWAQGTLQAFFIRTNPLTIPGLNLLQRLAHLEGLLHWFTSISRVGYLLMPLTYTFWGIIPLQVSGQELLYFFLPFYLVQVATFAWLNERSRSAVLSDIYSLVLCVPLAIAAIQAMLRPFGKGFKVTPKGTVSDRHTFNWQLAMPLLVMFGLTAAGLVYHLHAVLQATPLTPRDNFGIGWIWSLYNLLVLAVGLLILLDIPRPSAYEWFALKRTACLTVEGHVEGQIEGRSLELWGHTTMLSEIGAEIVLQQPQDVIREGAIASPVCLYLPEENLTLRGTATQHQTGQRPTLRVHFDALDLPTHRALIELLFCRPGQWQNRQTPGEFRSLWLLFRVLLRPRFLMKRRVDIVPVSVAQS